jgi:hypothetical protein
MALPHFLVCLEAADPTCREAVRRLIDDTQRQANSAIAGLKRSGTEEISYYASESSMRLLSPAIMIARKSDKCLFGRLVGAHKHCALDTAKVAVNFLSRTLYVESAEKLRKNVNTRG